MNVKILAFVFVLSFAFPSRSQSYMPFPDSGSVWQIDVISMGVFHPLDQMGVTGDTLIDTKNYHKISKLTEISSWDPFPTTHIASVREEDSLWWFIKSGDTIEYLLYDFSVTIGETISIFNPWIFEQSVLVVTSLDSILIQGQYRKRINLLNPLNEIEFWIEGIGSSNGIIYSGQATWDEGHLLMCFHENDTLAYINPEFNDCNYTTTGIDDNKTIVSANVFFTAKELRVHVISDLIHFPISITLHSTNGSLIVSREILQNQETILLDNLEMGIYIANLFDSQGNRFFTNRIVTN